MKYLALAAFCGMATLAPVPSAAAQVAGETTLGVTVEELKLVVLGWSVKKDMLDKDVYNDMNEDIGEVEDVIVSGDKNAKQVSWAILGVGGFLGLAEKLVAIPMSHLSLSKGKFILKGANKAALKAMPEFKYRAST